MFAFGQKGRTGEALKRGSYAFFQGDFVNKKAIAEMSLTEDARAVLYIFTSCNCLYDLYLQMKMSPVSGKKPWADFPFFLKQALYGIEWYELQERMVRGTISQPCIQVLARIAGYAMEHGVYPDAMSAAEVIKVNGGDDAAHVRQFIVACRDRFHAQTMHMFGWPK